MHTEEHDDKAFDNVLTGPFPFTLKDGTELMLDEWTIVAERWAKKKYGSMQKLYNNLMNVECDDNDTIQAAVAVAAFRLTEESRRIVNERRGEMTTEEWLESMLTYKNFADLCRAEYAMIRASIPAELLAAVKKNPTVMQHMTAKPKKAKK